MFEKPESITVRPVFIGYFFGANKAKIVFEDSSFTIYKKSNKMVVRYVDVSDQVSTFEGLIFNNVSFETESNKIICKWLSSKAAKKIYDYIYSSYIKTIADDMVLLHDQISSHFTSQYPRQAKWLNIKEECELWHQRFKVIPSADVVTPAQLHAFNYIALFAMSERAYLESLQEQYVSSQLDKYKNFFDTIESNPLTDNQRKACVIDEENNLVLAGAGTGKTSVMIGRAGYLTKSSNAQPDEILMLAFAKKAANEMSQRISEKLDGVSIKASTFHSLGQFIVSHVENGKPSLSMLAEDDKAFSKFIADCFHELLNNESYSETATTYFINYLNEDVDPRDYEVEGDYLQALIDNDIRTLKDEKVKSYQESVIANYLFQQGIEYIYEKKYEHSTRTIEFRQYQPDFYIPSADVYIEHYGIDKNNETAPYVDKDTYLKGMKWKRKTHKDYKTKCIETFHHEHIKGKLLKNLKHKLIENGVKFNPLPPEAILETAEENGHVTKLTYLLSEMLNLYKMSNLDIEGLKTKSQESNDSRRFDAAIELLTPLIDKYENHLHQNEDIDFNDMINKAIGYLKEGLFVPKWKYIMVDEFQDISGSRAELVQELQLKVADSSVFCVGDDWQAIYRFAGSDLNFTTKFSDVFGITQITTLDKTFRFNDKINAVAKQFVIKNPSQIKKDISTYSHVKLPAVSIMRAPSSTEEEALKNVEDVLNAISEANAKPVSILLLARYNFNLPDRSSLAQFKNKYSNLSITPMSIHASKGKEADYVILLNLDSGKYGFPSQKITHPLLEALLPEKDDFEFSEERRLLYVAITRAKRRVYLIGDISKPSVFMTELLGGDYCVETDEFIVSDEQLFYMDNNCSKCKTGNMTSRTSQHGGFYGCSHFPRCNHIENGCSLCGSLMKRNGQYKICTNVSCDGWIPVCSICNAEMVLRKGKYGEFWGCKNYRSQGISCSHSENNLSGPNIH